MLSTYVAQLAKKGEVYLKIKARPGAQATALKGIIEAPDGETIKIDVAAPAEKNKANQELIKFLSICFSVAKTAVKIISGAGEKVKLIKISSRINRE